jgi:hypothetical protein
MTTIVFPENTEEVIDGIRDAIGRPTEWQTVTLSGCYLCELDPTTNTATDSFCPVCSGLYWIPTYTTTIISGHVTWGYSEQLGWVTGGQLAEGECRVQIKYTVANLDVIENAKKIFVDGKEMQMEKKTLRGVQNINRILIDLNEKES